MAGTTKTDEKAVQEPTEAKAEAKVYNLRSSNKYLTVSSLGVQFMAGKYTTTDPAVARALLEIVKRYSSSLGEYNRPTSKLSDVGSYECTFMNTENSTSQLQPQKQNYTGVTLYVDPEADIRLGDVLYIYELDEYENIIFSSEYIAVADKPYKKRTHLEIPLISYEEV